MLRYSEKKINKNPTKYRAHRAAIKLLSRGSIENDKKYLDQYPEPDHPNILSIGYCPQAHPYQYCVKFHTLSDLSYRYTNKQTGAKTHLNKLKV